MESFDVVIVGAGAAGLMCAMAAGQRGRRVLLLEHNDQPGAKTDEVRMMGAGTHTEQNAGDQPADRIAVELK